MNCQTACIYFWRCFDHSPLAKLTSFCIYHFLNFLSRFKFSSFLTYCILRFDSVFSFILHIEIYGKIIWLALLTNIYYWCMYQFQFGKLHQYWSTVQFVLCARSFVCLLPALHFQHLPGQFRAFFSAVTSTLSPWNVFLLLESTESGFVFLTMLLLLKAQFVSLLFHRKHIFILEQ